MDTAMHDSAVESATDTLAARRHWMAVLARARTEELERAFRTLQPAPDFQWLRQPDTGLIMLRGRVGGTGAKFNLGEASLTRCVLRTDSGRDGMSYVGVSYVLGRDRRHAELAALFDALLQDPDRHDQLDSGVIRALEAAQTQRREAASRKAAATKVEFYTLARGDDE
jgi:alpha-D-ribose 1-methylphosphonate 5-triphosphate synthase subunit PhnG